MDIAGGTASLRKAAPQWSLAGDKQLLDILQNLHERIVNKCQAANTSLDEMITALDTASISLQNVNNRFMALSNSQFVESRVYDDDVDVATQEAPVKEPPKPVDTTTELSKLKDSLRVLESYHEAVHILDSDSDTGSEDEEDRLVFKPKDLYADRPLPYIIGSQKWRSKWHAGLMPEDSDTDSSTSKPGVPLEQYSDSEPEMDLPTDKPDVSQRTISTTSSIGSELTIPTVGKPADIAAELARRLGGNVPHVPETEPEPEQIAPTSVPTKVYRPEQPTTATIFPDEPPPLDNYQSDSYHSESEEDVFAELHRKGKPEPKPAWKAVDDLFGTPQAGGGLTSEREPTPAKQSSPLFEDTPEPELLVDKTPTLPHANLEKQPDIGVKKPVGGISLFGNNEGTESIGAAILKRNQRKVSTSDEKTDIEPSRITNKRDSKEINKETRANKSDKDTNKTKEIIESKNSKDKTQKDIINDLFAKPSKKVEKAAQKVEKPVKSQAPAKKVDLFADDLFDDIDDIFTSNIKPSAKETKETIKKSLFEDDDDDDLFASVADTSKKSSLKTETKTKSIFDSDDDLFSDKKEEKNATQVDNVKPKTPTEISTKTLFQDKEGSVNSIITKSVSKSNNSQEEETKKLQEKSSIKSNKIKSIFDNDSDDDIFSDLLSNNSNSSLQKANKINDDVNRIKEETKKTETSNIDDFEKEDLFLTKEVQTNVINTITRPQTINEKVIKNDEFVDDDESLFKTEKLSSIPKDNKVNNSTIDKNVVGVKEFDDDLFKKKKTDEVLEESIENSPESKINSVSYSEDELFSSKNIDISAPKVKTSSILNKPKVSNTQFNSPSLFDDDDDDIDSLFANSITSTKPKKINTKSDNINFDSALKHDPKEIESTENIRASSVDGSEKKIFNKPVNNSLKDTRTFQVKSETDEIESKIDNNSMSESDLYSDSGANSNVSQNIYDQRQESEVDVLRDQNVINTPNTRGESEVNFISTKHLEQEPNIQSKILPSEPTESKIPIPISIEKPSTSSEDSKEPFAKDEFDDSIPVEKESKILQQNDSKTDDNKAELLPTPKDPDIFSDIFSDVPPEFERPKEPKKSKNVNALFDDDSDDEALFFKKNDVITDEKPDVNFGNQEDRLFHIFHDEPPAIDVDFTQKPTKTSQDKEIKSWNTDPEIPNLDSKTDINQEKTISTTSEKILEKESKDLIDEVKKPVGKLKPMNFNINVNTLLPGASPKKSKSNEQVDGQTISTNLAEVTKEPETKMIKSVSFEGDPDSEILDNKLSKERAKIQVKRRPSSRRARKEAVRKSGIDFGDDSTDNSSSTDISKKDDQFEIKNEVLESRSSPTTDKLEKSKDTTVLDAVETSDKTQYKSTNENSEKLSEEISKTTVEAVKSDNIKPNISENASLTSPYNSRSNVKSKVVYILNDEDIFNDAKPTKSKFLNIVDDDDELFKSSTSSNTKIPTVGNVYKHASTKQKDIDKIDSDEDIFKASMEKDKTLKSEDKIQSKTEIDQMEAKIDKLFVKSQNKPKSLFDDLSDDENELFGGRKSTKKPDVFESNVSSKDVKKEVKMPKVDVKGSLFGDESDDDDLFGAKSTKSKESTQSTSKPKDVISKPAEPVIEDPLTLLSQEDDF